jgi:hypothetical protein
MPVVANSGASALEVRSEDSPASAVGTPGWVAEVSAVIWRGVLPVPSHAPCFSRSVDAGNAELGSVAEFRRRVSGWIGEPRLATLAAAPGAEAIEIQSRMVDREGVTRADGREHRCDHVFSDIVDALAIGADKVMVMLGVASDVRGDVAIALESAGHPVLDLLLKRAIDGRAADRRMRRADALVQLLGRERALRRGEGLGDDHALCRAAAAAGGKTRID